ncbi:MAG: hypothetical protein ACFFCE_00255 [Promethearchaeota archaeon]
MNKKMRKTPSKKKTNNSTLYKKNKISSKNSGIKNIKKISPNLKKPTDKKSKNLLENTTLIQKKKPDQKKVTNHQWKKSSLSLSLESHPKDTQNHENHPQDLQMNNEKITTQKWKNLSQTKFKDKILNRKTKDNQAGKDKEKKEKNLIKSLKEKQEEWFKGLKKTLENSMKNLNDSQKKSLENFNNLQKKAIDNLEKSLLNKFSSKGKENEFLKEMILDLLAQNFSSKDLHNLGQAKISTEERESYL